MATYDATVTLTIKVLISDNQPLPRGAWEWNQLSEMSEEEIEVELMDPSVRAIEQLAEAGHVEIDDITIARKEGYDIVSLTGITVLRTNDHSGGRIEWA